jgi:hypothetical protein
VLPVKKVYKRVRKAKPDSVHMPPMDSTISGNVQVFPEANFSNPIAKNGELLFEPPVQNHNGPNGNKVNLKHPRAPFYLRLIKELEQKKGKEGYDSYIDDISSFADNTKSESEKERTKAKLALRRKLKPKKVMNPGRVHFTQKDCQSYKEGWDDRDNNPNSYAYDGFDNGYHRCVSPTNISAQTNN